VTKAITAVVIAILNVNIRFHPQAGEEGRNCDGEEALGRRPSAGSRKGMTAILAPLARYSTLLTLAKLRL
jgi:hypothetical protein